MGRDGRGNRNDWCVLHEGLFLCAGLNTQPVAPAPSQQHFPLGLIVGIVLAVVGILLAAFGVTTLVMHKCVHQHVFIVAGL